MVVGLALLTAQAASAFELSDMNDCELAGHIMQDATPYIQKVMSFSS